MNGKRAAKCFGDEVARQRAEGGLVVTLSKRVTVAHCSHREDAIRVRDRERRAYPAANVKVSGEPGKWKVRRDRIESDPPLVRPCRRQRL